jgi:CPA2 family monovalent cation:H+ antiporter-2
MWSLVFDLVILLFSCVGGGAVASRFGQSPIVGYLLAGMVLGGPGGVSLVGSQEELDIIAELGVSLLLFSLGLEFSWKRLQSFGSRTLFAGVLQIGVSLLFFAIIAFLFGCSLATSIAIGAILSVSSTACVLRVLSDKAELDSAYARQAISILLVQDIAIVPLALLLPALGAGGESHELLMLIGVAVGKTLLLVFGIALFIQAVALRIFGAISIEENRELAILFGAAIGFGATWAAHELSLSPAIGAFLAGMFLGSSPFATQIRADITPIKTLLLALFFGAAGMAANPVWIVQHFPLVLLTTLSFITIKAAIITGILHLLHRPLALGLATGITISQAGEFAFVLGTLALQHALIDSDAYLLIISSTIISLLLSPFLISHAPSLGGRISQLFGAGIATSDKAKQPHEKVDVVIIGFGPAGVLAAEPFTEYGKRLLIIDLNRDAMDRAERLGFSSLIGDASVFDVLAHAEIRSAKLFILTLPHHVAAKKAIRHIRSLAPESLIVVRARHQFEFESLKNSGAHGVVGDEEQVGQALREMALELGQQLSPQESESEE